MLPPAEHRAIFRTTVHGTGSGERAVWFRTPEAGDLLLLIPGPPGQEELAVWVQLATGEPLGHLPPEINV